MKVQKAKNSQDTDLYWELWSVLDGPLPTHSRYDFFFKLERKTHTMLYIVSLNKCQFDHIAALSLLPEQGNSVNRVIRFSSILG